VVQGVGFRPFVFRLAHECRLAGFVLNDGGGVLIETEGPASILDRFKARLQSETPSAARIDSLSVEALDPRGDTAFEILGSDRGAKASTLISPDIAVCDDCLREMAACADRRYRYPFINCTNCGPRFTIVQGIPYDRPFTSMSGFKMCPDCEREYTDPHNRRFHAQPNACPVCGPRLTLRDQNGEVATDDPIVSVATLLKQGKIVALRGLGGFHLAVDAFNTSAVELLRTRKARAEKPFALMARDLAMVRMYCETTPEEELLLSSPARPIVILCIRNQGEISPSVAPGQKYLGFMLPYTPLHHLLMEAVDRPLVMTSGNFSEEPIVISNDEAMERLAPLADVFLLHDREIVQRCEDSITRVVSGNVRLVRRSRGFVPLPVETPLRFSSALLAVGGELKNTVALARDNHIFLSQHIGDLDNPEAYRFFQHCIDHLKRILQIDPQAAACDLHPAYLSAQWARKQTELPLFEVQHHHAHLAAVMAENGVTERCLGIILDGTGYGTDGTVWGGELLLGEFGAFERLSWLETVPMPGGEAAIKEPWRMALSWLVAAYGDVLEKLELPLLDRIGREHRAVILQMIDKNVNSPLTSSCGRLFDAVASMLDLGDRVNYEAQAAIALEMTADPSEKGWYETALPRRRLGPLSVVPLIRAIVDELAADVEKSRIAAHFHRTLAELLVRAAIEARDYSGVNVVGLSGGVYQNRLFLELMHDLLRRAEFRVLTHSQVPTNDGGLALGQALVANARLSALEREVR